jgi:hypothetical protein
VVKEGCFKLVQVEVPIMFSPYFLGDRAHTAVSNELVSRLFRYSPELSGTPLMHGRFHFKQGSPLKASACVVV